MNTQGWRVGSLFAGIGGFDLAARNVGWRTAWVSEIHPYASRVLARHFPDAPNHGDITQIDFTRVEPVEVLCGGFPCQDISNAGKRAGIAGARSGLWSHYARAIGELRPCYVVVENVSALLRRGLGRVLGDLAALGYDAEWHCIPASAVGAPHRRDRIWIVAYPHRDRWGASGRQDGGAPTRPGEPVAQGGTQLGIESGRAIVAPPRSPLLHRPFPGRTGWHPEPGVGRVVDGLPEAVDRIAGLGNAIVPQVAEVIFRAIQAHEKGEP